MDISTILKLIAEFGPGAVMFAFGLGVWYQISTKLQKDQERAEERNEKLVDKLVDVLDKQGQKKEKEHQKGEEYRKKVICQCDMIASELLKETGADKVSIFEYSNGSKNLAGIPFLHFSPIAEKTESGFKNKEAFNLKLDITTLGVFLIDLEKEHMITIKNIKKESEKYPELGHYLGMQKQHKGVYANLVGIKSSTGFISITFNHNKKVDYAKVESVLYNYTQKISNFID